MQKLSEKQVKKHQTNIKSAVGAYGLTLIMTLVFVVKAFLGKNFFFYFCNYLPELMLKRAAFTAEYEGAFSDAFLASWRGTLPAIWFGVFFAVYAAVCVALLLIAGKHPPFIWVLFAFQLVDTVCLLVGRLQGIPDGMTETVWIDVIFHVLVLLFLLVGGVSAVRLPKELRGDPRADALDQIIRMEDKEA